MSAQADRQHTAAPAPLIEAGAAMAITGPVAQGTPSSRDSLSHVQVSGEHHACGTPKPLAQGDDVCAKLPEPIMGVWRLQGFCWVRKQPLCEMVHLGGQRIPRHRAQRAGRIRAARRARPSRPLDRRHIRVDDARRGGDPSRVAGSGVNLDDSAIAHTSG